MTDVNMGRFNTCETTGDMLFKVLLLFLDLGQCNWKLYTSSIKLTVVQICVTKPCSLWGWAIAIMLSQLTGSVTNFSGPGLKNIHPFVDCFFPLIIADYWFNVQNLPTFREDNLDFAHLPVGMNHTKQHRSWSSSPSGGGKVTSTPFTYKQTLGRSSCCFF